MAIVNSILGYKLSGKLSNLIFQFYNGKTIVRSLNTSISKPPSVKQIANQNKFKNCKAAFIFSGSFFGNLIHYNSMLFNVESIFFAKFYSKFNSDPFVSNLNSWLQLQNTDTAGNSFMTVNSIEPIISGAFEGGTLIRFTALLPYEQVEPTINILVVDSKELEAYVSYYDLPKFDYENGVYRHLPMSDTNTLPACYFSSKKLKLSSNIYIN